MSKSESSLSDVLLSNVYGPFLYTDPIQFEYLPMMIDNTFRFFIPRTSLPSSTSSLNLQSATMFGNNIYQYNSSMPMILHHQGIRYFKKGNERGSRLLNIYDENYDLVRCMRKEINVEDAIGFEIIFKVIDKVNFVGSEQFGVKTKSSGKRTACGFAIIFGQPIFEQIPLFKLNLILGIEDKTNDESEGFGGHWLKFGLTGEASNSYDVNDFVDDGLPVSEWLFNKLKKGSVYLDTDMERFELSLNEDYTLKLSKLNELISLRSIENELTPIKDSKKKVLENSVAFNRICWNEIGLKIDNKQYGQFLNYFWCKRKKILE